MTHREKRIFFNWLQKHDALEKFRHNRHVFLKSYYGRGWRNRVGYSMLHIAEAVGSAFSWDETPEGGQYWQNLDTKWLVEHDNIIEYVL